MMDKPEQPPAVPEAASEAMEAKTERIAVMRHELADLQRQLIDAQQRIAAELQGRAEDADRFEELEARAEAKAQDNAAQIAKLSAEGLDLRARLDSATKTIEELRRDVETRDARIESATKTGEELRKELEARDARIESATKTIEELRRDVETRDEQARKQTEQLEQLAASLRETKALLAERDTELATRTSERDEQTATRTRLEGELDEVRRALDSGRSKAQELSQHLAKFGQEMLDVIVARDPRSTAPAKSTESTPVVETRPVLADEPPVPKRSAARTVLLVLGGIAVGVAATLAIVQLMGSTKTAEHDVTGASPAPSSSANVIANSPPTELAGNPTALPEDAASAPSDAPRVGIIVLPPEADGHRVFVDGHRTEPKNGRVEVPCGKHEVQIGGGGAPRAIDVACDGETALR